MSSHLQYLPCPRVSKSSSVSARVDAESPCDQISHLTHFGASSRDTALNSSQREYQMRNSLGRLRSSIGKSCQGKAVAQSRCGGPPCRSRGGPLRSDSLFKPSVQAGPENCHESRQTDLVRITWSPYEANHLAEPRLAWRLLCGTDHWN